MHARPRLRPILAALALFACAPQSSRAEPGDTPAASAERPAAKADFEWSGELAAGGRLEIGNVNGDVRVRPGSGTTVRVRGTKSGKDAGEVRIDVDAKSGRVAIHPEYPQHRRNFDARVDFVVEVPSGVTVEADVVNGDVDVQGIAAALELSSVNGTIAATDCPDVRGNTVNGKVRVQLPKRGAKRATLEAVNGELEVRMAAGVGARVRANTLSGSIRSDFPLAHTDELVGRRASGTIGDGSTAIDLETVNGTIRLQKT